MASGALIAGFMTVPALVPLSGVAGAAGPHSASHAVAHVTPPGPAPVSHNTAHVQRPLLGQAPRLATVTKTFTVNTTNDTDQATPGSGVCADSDGNCSLRAATEEANSEGTTTPAMGTIAIVVPAGTYTLTMGTALQVSDPAGVAITGAGASSTVIQQTTSPADGVIDVLEATSTEGANAALSGVTVAGGSQNFGGGIWVEDSNDLLQLTSTTVSGNSAGEGGGIYNGGQLWDTSSIITNNTANDSEDGPQGGGLYCDGPCSLTNTSVNGNNATSTTSNEVDGGGIYVDDSLIMQGGSISFNTATNNTTESAYGGGMYVDDSTVLNGVTIDSNSVSSSVAHHEEGFGGGVYSDFGLDTVSNTTFSGNQATSYFASGGALAIGDGGPVITGSTISNNQANGDGDTGWGGGVATYSQGGVTIADSTITGNTANDPVDGGYGGGINACCSGGLNLTDSTVSNNTASGLADGNYGGGIYGEADGGIVVSGSTLSGNTAVDGFGGGAYDDSGSTTFSNDQVTGNSTPGSDGCGGGLYLDDGGHVQGTTVSGNTAGNCGGGVYVDSPLILQTSTVAGNSANLGGGLYLDDILQAENSTIANNSTTGASDQGGAVYMDSGSMSLRFVTVNGNTSDDGSAVFNNDGGGSIGSSIVQSSCDAVSGAQQFTSAGHNVLGDSSCTTPTSSDQSGVSNFGLSATGQQRRPSADDGAADQLPGHRGRRHAVPAHR